MNAIFRWPIEIPCPKCNVEDEVLISEFSVERTGLLFVEAFCSTCQYAFTTKFSVFRIFAEAEEQDNAVDQRPPAIDGTWIVPAKPSKPN